MFKLFKGLPFMTSELRGEGGKKIPQICRQTVPGGATGWPAGNGKKLSSSKAKLGQATCLAVA